MSMTWPRVISSLCALHEPACAHPSDARSVALGVGALSQLVEGRLLRREPSVALQAARMSTTNMMFNAQRARVELGHSPRPAAEAFVDSARWFVENGYVAAKRAAHQIPYVTTRPVRARLRRIQLPNIRSSSASSTELSTSTSNFLAKNLSELTKSPMSLRTNTSG
jgi:hypothetical protein